MLAPLLVLLTAIPQPASARAEGVVAATCDPVLADVLRDVLAESPALAVAGSRSAAARARAGGAGLLPDPMLQLRTTTDRGGASWQDTTDVEVMAAQPITSRARRRAEASQAEAMALSESANAEAARLDALMEAARWYFEVAQLDALEELRRDELQTLRAFAESARGRYATGGGRQQDPLRAQAEVTRGEMELVEIASRRAQALSALNELRGHDPAEPLRPSSLPDPAVRSLASSELRDAALARAPALEAARHDIAAAESGEAIARKASTPDITLGGFYEGMDLGGGMPGGDRDQFGVVVGISLPVRHARIASGIDEAVALRLASAQAQRATEASVRRQVTDALTRSDEARRAWSLQDEVLGVQSEEGLRSALSGYSSGDTTSLDVLDAVRVAYEVRAAGLRARADAAMADAALRSLVGGALPGEAPCVGVAIAVDEPGLSEPAAGSAPSRHAVTLQGAPSPETAIASGARGDRQIVTSADRAIASRAVSDREAAPRETAAMKAPSRHAVTQRGRTRLPRW